MSQHSGSVSLLSEHPASPALLTSHGPHRSHCSTNCEDFRTAIQPVPPKGHVARIGPHRVQVTGLGDPGDRKEGAWLSLCSAPRFLRPSDASAPLVPPAASHHSWDEHAQKTGRTAVTQTPAVAKKRAWVVRTHSQFEDRLRSWAPQGWPLMRCFTGCNQSR